MVDFAGKFFGTGRQRCAFRDQRGRKSRVQIIDRNLEACFHKATLTGGPQVAKADVSVMHDGPRARQALACPICSGSGFAVADDALDLAKVVDAPVGVFAPVAGLFVATERGRGIPIGVVQVHCPGP